MSKHLRFLSYTVFAHVLNHIKYVLYLQAQSIVVGKSIISDERRVSSRGKPLLKLQKARGPWEWSTRNVCVTVCSKHPSILLCQSVHCRAMDPSRLCIGCAPSCTNAMPLTWEYRDLQWVLGKRLITQSRTHLPFVQNQLISLVIT